MPAAQAYAPPGFWGHLQGWFGSNSHGVIPYGFQDASRRQGSESPGA
ncbi:hypothetical protein [Photorhabdus sp. MH8.4]